MTIYPSEAREDQIGSPHCTTPGGAVPIFVSAMAGGLGLKESTLAMWLKFRANKQELLLCTNQREAGVTVGQQAAQAARLCSSRKGRALRSAACELGTCQEAGTPRASLGEADCGGGGGCFYLKA